VCSCRDADLHIVDANKYHYPRTSVCVAARVCIDMAQNTVCHQDLNVSDGIVSAQSIGLTPSSEFIPVFGSGARSSTWPMSQYESFEAAFGYGGERYENDDENENVCVLEEAESEANISGVSEPRKYCQPESFSWLIRPSNLRGY
jgi:hypothetical protein